MITDNSPFRVRIVNIRPKRNSPLDTGEFSFNGDVLEQLPRYFEYVDLMRKVDDDAYALFSRIGATILPRDKYVMAPSVERAGEFFSIADVPAFGCLYLPHRDDDGNDIYADFLWWTKLAPRPMPGIEAAEGPIFHVTALYHDKGKAVLPMSWHVSAPTFETARVLKEYSFDKVNMVDKAAQYDRRAYAIPQRDWKYPRVLRTLCAERRQKPNEVGTDFFAIAATAVMSRRVGFQVRVAKAGRYAVFNIDDSASPTFFKDRDVQVNENGRTKKIFHFVPGYQRHDGKVVKGHTKGLREFDWNGYSIHIGKPDHDFANPDNLTAPAHRFEDADIPPAGSHYTMAEIGVLVQRHIRQSALRKRGGKKRRK